MQTDNQQQFIISAVIPAYNSEKHIVRAIESVLRQTRPADEIIVVDDGSADGTADQVRKFGDQVHLITQKNAGASAARNAGIEAARGNWIAFLDADDEWLPEKLKLQIEHLRRHPDLTWTTGNFKRCHCENGHRQFDAYSISPAEDTEVTDYFKAYTSQRPGHTAVMLIKKEILIEAGLFRVGQLRINDEDLWFRIVYRRPETGFISQPLAIYHMGTIDSISKWYRDPFIICDFLERHVQLAEEYGKQDAFRPCARNMAKMWIHQCWQDERIFQIRSMLRRLGLLLPKRYKIIVYMLTFFPGITRRCMPFFRKINKIFKIPI
jgi:glycosyltransferase involved in cell wall biosynthesis